MHGVPDSFSVFSAQPHVLKEAGLVEMEKSGKRHLYGVVPDLKDQLAANSNVLELGCCTFRFDKLPR